MEELKIIVAKAQAAGESEETIKTIIEAYKASNPAQFQSPVVGKTNGSQKTDVTVEPQTVSKDTVSTSESTSSESQKISDTWVDAEGNPVTFEYPEVKITGDTKEEEIPEIQEKNKKSIVDAIKDVNIYKGYTLRDLFGKDEEEEKEIVEEQKPLDISTIEAETATTAVPEPIIPEVTEEEYVPNYFFNETTGKVESDRPTAEDMPKILDILKEDEKSMPEPKPELATTFAGDAITLAGDVAGGLKKISKMAINLYNSPEERKETIDQVGIMKDNFDNNMVHWMQSLYIDTATLLEKSLINLSPYTSGRTGITAMDALVTGKKHGEAVWFGPKGQLLPVNDKTLTNKEKAEQGYELIYKESGVRVGDHYRNHIMDKYQYLLEVEALKKQTNVSVSLGYKENDPSKFFGGIINAFWSFGETMAPAIATWGWSLIPQITAPMFTSYNREKAKRLYPNLTEAEAISELIRNDQQDVVVPNLLGIFAGSLERVGYKGVMNAMRLNRGTFSSTVGAIIFGGQREGFTEWNQTGIETLNEAIAQGKSLTEAFSMAWAKMAGPEGLEAYLQGMLAGTGVSGLGNLAHRALRSDVATIKDFNTHVRTMSDLQVKINQEPNKSNRDRLQKRLDASKLEIIKIINKTSKIKSYLTEAEQQDLDLLMQEYDGVKAAYNQEYSDAFKGVLGFAKDQGITLEQALQENYPKLYDNWLNTSKELNDQAKRILDDIDVIRKRGNERLIDAGVENAKGVITEDGVEVFETEQQLQDYLDDPANQDIFEKERKRREMSLTDLKNLYKKSDGWYVRSQDKVYVNKPRAIEVGAVSVVEHEVAHYLFNKKLYVGGELTQKGKETLNNFINALPISVFKDITDKLSSSKAYILSDPNIKEEYMNFYIDGLRNGSYKPNKRALNILGDDVLGLLKANGYDLNIKFNNIQDIINWATSYVDNIRNGKIVTNKREPETTATNVSLSLTELEEPVKKLGRTNQDAWNNGGANDAIAYIYGKLDGIIRNKITSKMRDLPGFSEEDFIQTTYTELIPHIRNFIPAQYNEDGSRKLDGSGELIGNDNLWAWITNQIKNKALEALKGPDVTKTTFETSIQDEGSFINDIESEAYVDIELAIEEDVTYSGLRNILKIQRGSKLHKKIIEGIKKLIPLEVKNINSPKFKNAIRKYFRDYLFDDIKKIIGGTATKDAYKNFITNNAEALYNIFPQKVFNKSFQDFIVETETNIPPTRVDELIKEGKLPKTTPRDSGPSLFGKLPWNEDTEQKWIDNFLNPVKGRPASKQNSLIELLSYTLGVDATMEVINTEEFMNKYNLSEVVIATIGMKIDRGANVKFSDTSGEVNLNENNFTDKDAKDATDMVRYIGQEYDFDELDTVDLSSMLKAEFPEANEDVIALVTVLADKGTIENMQGVMFKKGIQLSKFIDKKDKDQIKEDGNIRYNKTAKDKINDAANIVAPKLGPDIMNLLGYDIFGYISRVLDAARRKKNPEYEYDKTQPQYKEDDAGNEISGPYYDALEALKLKVKNSKVKLPEGIVLEDLRLMNKKFPLFKKIEKILFDGETTGEFNTNVEWKKNEISKLTDEINAAGEANIKLAKFIAKEIIKSNKIDVPTAIHIFQLQTNAVSGFRALTTLDLITILEGSQKPGKNHPYYKKEYKKAKNATNKKGEKKYKTKKEIEDAAIKALETKGEHAAANANTMLKLAELKARYMKDKNINLDLELEKIFQGHGQIHGTKGTFADLDKFGTTNVADWLRGMLDPSRKDMFSPDGKTSEEVIIEKQVTKEINERTAENKSEVIEKTSTTSFSTTELNDTFNQMLEENEGVKKHAKYSDAKARILGSKVVKFWDYIYPPSAYDLELFLYRILGKGNKGELDLAFFKKALLDPYNEAYTNIQREAQRVKKEYRSLIEKLPKVRKNLKKTVPGTKFTYDQAVRVAIWIDKGIDMQEMGLSKADQKALLKAVNSDKELITFKEALKNLSRDKEGYPNPTNYWTVETIANDIAIGINSISRAKFLAEWKENIKAIFSKDNLNKLRAIYGDDYVEALEDMLYRMEYGRGKQSTNRIERNWNNWVNNSVGAIMFFNFRSAVLQTISALNYVDFEDNTPHKAALAFANFPQFIKDVVFIFNSDFSLERRGGNRRTINEAELTEYLRGKENKAKAIIAYLLEKGFTPTQIADSLAIALGGATFYRNKINKYIKEALSEQEAKKRAFKDFLDKTEKGQQSSRPDLISQQQAGGLGRLILAFKNTPMQYNRLMIKAILDLKNGRGKASSNVAKITYYAFVQNVIFNTLQTALFAALGDEEEWDTRKERVANGMIDSILNGMGLTGAVAVTIKNGFLRYRREKARGWNADHTRTIIEFANLSPTIGSKLRKLYSSIRTEQLNQDAIEAMGFNIENPAFNSLANLVSAVTNVPLDRAVSISQNLVLASKDETEFWDSLMLVLGWQPWDVGIEQTSRKVQREEKERKREEKKEQKKLEKQKQKEEEGKKKQEQEKKEGKKITCIKCKNPVIPGSKYCTVHEPKKERADGKEVQCKKIKKDGKRCGMKTKNKSGLCYYHD